MVALVLSATWDDEAEAAGAGSGISAVEFGIEHVLPSVVAEAWAVGTPTNEEDYTDPWNYSLTGIAAGAQFKVRSRSPDNDGNVGTETPQITVNVPEFTSVPDTTADLEESYSLNVTATDPGSETLTITAPTKPAWLSITTVGGGSETLSGTAPSEATSDLVTLRVTNATSGIYVEQSFYLQTGALGGGLVSALSMSLVGELSNNLSG